MSFPSGILVALSTPHRLSVPPRRVFALSVHERTDPGKRSLPNSTRSSPLRQNVPPPLPAFTYGCATACLRRFTRGRFFAGFTFPFRSGLLRIDKKDQTSPPSLRPFHFADTFLARPACNLRPRRALRSSFPVNLSAFVQPLFQGGPRDSHSFSFLPPSD